MFDPNSKYLSAYSPNDGTIEFYNRICSLINENSTVVDFGAGRGSWINDKCEYRLKTRTLKNKVNKLIGIDIDEEVLQNKSTHQNFILKEKIPLPDNSVDLVICDWVLEHVENPSEFYYEINRILKPNGFFVARTPYKYSYLALIAKIVPNKLHKLVVSYIQKEREKEDVFPTYYRLNTKKKISKVFKNFENYSYFKTPDPAYYFNNRIFFFLFELLHKFAPKHFTSMLFVFLKKKSTVLEKT